MRLISQDGTMDFPYEMSVIWIDKRTSEIKLGLVGEPSSNTVAKYSTEYKAIKAMEMLHETYMGKVIFQNVEITDDVEKMLKNWRTQAVICKTDSKSSIDCINSSIFQFPKDEDVEV